MIAYLQGKVLQKTPQFLIVENAGLGYKILVTPELLEKPVGEIAEFYTYHKSTDDGQTLFGMPDFPTLQFFELLITVTGVGPKVALTIVSAAKIDTLQQAIVNQDADIFIRMSGVGKKTAERIMLELRSKIAGGILGDMPISGSDIYDALINLGYKAPEVRGVISKLDTSADMTDQLKQALKLLGR